MSLLYAYNEQGEKKHIEEWDKEIDGKIAYTENKEYKLIPKKGEIVIHHFSHYPGEGDNWSEKGGMTEWHKNWQEKVKRESCEITIKINGITHRADIVNKEGRVIEIQHSLIPLEQIRAREKFYKQYEGKDLIWVFDQRNLTKNGKKYKLQTKIDFIYNNYISFRIVNQSRINEIESSKSIVFLDTDEYLIQLKNLNKGYKLGKKYYFVGEIISYERFDKNFFKEILKGEQKYKQLEIKSLDYKCFRDDYADKYPEFIKDLIGYTKHKEEAEREREYKEKLRWEELNESRRREKEEREKSKNDERNRILSIQAVYDKIKEEKIKRENMLEFLLKDGGPPNNSEEWHKWKIESGRKWIEIHKQQDKNKIKHKDNYKEISDWYVNNKEPYVENDWYKTHQINISSPHFV